MNSRRELLMAGIPDLDDRAFVRHGRNIKPQLGGGGGGSTQPSHTTQTVNNVPAFIQPYIESLLGRAQALGTDAQFEPFDPNQRFEGTTGLQQASYDRAASMGTAPELDAATGTVQSAINQAGMAGVDGQRLMDSALFYGGQAANMGQKYNTMATDPSQVSSFMSPYMQNVVDVQKQQAIRDYQSQLPQMQAAATNAGAFGGSRHAILEAEGQRNLNQNLADIQARGQQAAYEQAMQSMQFGQNLGLQGFQTGLQGVGQGINAAQLGLQGINTQLQGANTLGQLGQTRFNQNMGITELLNAMGTQQQQQGQQRRDFEYQQFLDELNFPYQQLAFMSDMTRGLPLSQSTVYQNSAQPNMTSQLIGGGLAAYGLLNRAKGGVIPKPKKKYAQGGQVDGSAFSNMNVDETTATLESLSDEELAQYAAVVQDAVTLSLIRAESERRARMRQQPGQMPQSTVAQDVAQQAAPTGIAALMQPAPEDTQRPQPAMRAGGIVALQAGGRVDPRAAQAERDRATLQSWGRSIADGAAKTGAAAADLFTLPVRGAMGAVNTLIRVPNAFGLEVPYIPEAAFGGSSTSMTPYLDQLRDPAAQQEPPMQVTVSGVTPPVPGTEVVPQVPGETREDRDARIFGPLEQSVRGSDASAATQGGGTRDQGPAAAVAQQMLADQATAGVPKTFEEYLSMVDQRATQSLEEKMLLDAMRAGLDERQARVVAQENRGKMDALIAAGAAMMRGTSLAEGLALGSEAGAAALRDANETQQKLEEGLSRAREEQARYELALRKDNEKTARDAYDKWLRYDQQNTQWAAELKLKQAALAQDYQLGMAKIGAMGGPGGVDYRAVAAAETRIAALPETAAFKKLSDPVTAGTMTPQERAIVEDNYNRARARVYQQMGIPMIDSGGYDSGGAGGAWSIVE